MMLSNTDKENVMSQIKNFFQNIATLDSGLALKNSLIINYLFICLIWMLGFSLIGVVINIFLTYIRGFLVGFTISSIFLTYGYKGLPASILYCSLSQILNIIIVMMLSIYSIMFSLNIIKIITSKSHKEKLILKRYFIILMISIILSFISSLSEAYIFPNILKMIISIYSK